MDKHIESILAIVIGTVVLGAILAAASCTVIVNRQDDDAMTHMVDHSVRATDAKCMVKKLPDLCGIPERAP